MGANPQKILVIDDDESLFLSLRAILKLEFGEIYEVMQSCTGEEALNVLLDEEITVCIVDYRLPGINGLNVLKVIQERFPYIPTIFLSAYLDEELKEKALSFDFGAYYTVYRLFCTNFLLVIYSLFMR